MAELTETRESPTRAYVIHPDLGNSRTRRSPDLALEEAIALAHALPAIEVVGAEVAKLRKPDAGMLFSKGKREEIGQRLKDAAGGEGAELVLVDGPVTPVQQRNLEKEWGVKLLDRTGLILEIFADRAQTREGVLQVELAALAYQRTRLVRAWTHLERQRGGFGFVGGPGETQIEADRRAIDEQMIRLRRQLERVVRTRELHRKARAKVPYPIVALVGYTNAGKSTLFNRLTGAGVMAEDLLFATLDPTMRRIRLPGVDKAILSDTVGFISDLPTQLVAAFRATLEEVTAADVIVHVRDIANPDTAAQKRMVLDVLGELGLIEAEGATPKVPIVEAWNKWDLLDGDRREDLRELITAHSDEVIVPVSALTGEGCEELLEAVGKLLTQGARLHNFVLPASDGQRLAWLHAHGEVISDVEAGEDERGPLRRLEVRLDPRELGRFARL